MVFFYNLHVKLNPVFFKDKVLMCLSVWGKGVAILYLYKTILSSSCPTLKKC